jgi:hypothetical protein
MTDDVKPLRRKPTEKQLAALRKGRLSPKRAEGSPPKRAGPAYRREVRTAARKDQLAAQKARRTAKLFAGTNIEPPPPPDLPTYSEAGRKEVRRAADPGSYVIDPPPALDGITAAELAGILPPEPEDDPDRPRVRYNRLIADAICERISHGEPLQAICAIDGMPTAQQVMTWARTKPEFKALYDEARTLQADFLADRMLGLAQRVLDDPKDAAAIRVAADILAKQAEWRAPRKFGPRMDLTVTEAQRTPDQIRSEALALQEELGIPEEKRIH